MNKIAKLVTVSFTSRVIVNETATPDEIIHAAKENIQQRIELAFGNNVTSITDDKECPFGTYDFDTIS
jgi:hypothetical protein